jgi:hypothetical protein
MTDYLQEIAILDDKSLEGQEKKESSGKDAAE